MKGSVFRGFLLGCITMVLAAFSFSVPSFATERIASAHVIHIYDPGDFIPTPQIVAIAEERQEFEAPDARSSINTGPLSPVYLLSHRTDGQSLADFHMRC